jgi:hypothetical protein
MLRRSEQGFCPYRCSGIFKQLSRAQQFPVHAGDSMRLSVKRAGGTLQMENNTITHLIFQNTSPLGRTSDISAEYVKNVYNHST